VTAAEQYRKRFATEYSIINSDSKLLALYGTLRRQGYSHEMAFAKVQEAHLAQHQRRTEQAKKLDERHAKLHPPRPWEQKATTVFENHCNKCGRKWQGPPGPVCPDCEPEPVAQVGDKNEATGPEWPFDDWGTIHDKDEPEYAVFTSGRE